MRGIHKCSLFCSGYDFLCSVMGAPFRAGVSLLVFLSIISPGVVFAAEYGMVGHTPIEPQDATELSPEENDQVGTEFDVAPLDENVSAFISDQYYSAGLTQSYEPLPHVFDGDRELVLGKDYLISYQDNVRPGRAYAHLSGVGDYCGDLVLAFEILTDAPLDGAYGIDCTTVPESSLDTYFSQLDVRVVRQDDGYYHIIDPATGLALSYSYGGDGSFSAFSVDWRDLGEVPDAAFGWTIKLDESRWIIAPSISNRHVLALNDDECFALVPLDYDEADIKGICFLDQASKTESNHGQTEPVSDVSYLSDVRATRNDLDKLAALHRNDVLDGTYIIRSAQQEGLVFDIAGGTKQSGGNAQLYSFNGSDAQRWRITHDDGGYVTLTNLSSLKALDVFGGKTQSGTNIQQYVPNGTWAQKWIACKNADGSMVLVSALEHLGDREATCQVADIESACYATGSNIQTYELNGTDAQRWSFENVEEMYRSLDKKAAINKEVLADGEYYISWGDTRNLKTLDVQNGSKENGACVQSFEFNGTGAQRWIISHDSKGYVTFKNKNSGKVLDVSSAAMANGTSVNQYESNGSLAQKWIVELAGSGVAGSSYRIASALFSGLSLDVRSASLANGAPTQIWTMNSTGAQSFGLFPVQANVGPCEDILEEGWYTVSPNTRLEVAFDIASASTSDGANLQLFSKNETFAQLFSFEYVEGYYLIRNAQSGKVLDVENGCPLPGANVQQWASNQANPNQLWSIKKNEDGSYSFLNKKTGLALDLVGGSTESGVNVNAYAPNGTSAQCFLMQGVKNFIKDGLYTICPATNESVLLDVNGASIAEGANVQLYEENNSVAQKWRVTEILDNDGVYTLESLVSGRYMTAEADGNVCLRSERSDTSQLWRPEISRGAIVLRNVRYGRALNVRNGSLSSGSNIQLSSNNVDVQRFIFKPTDPISNGVYTISSFSNPSLVVDVVSGSRLNGANVQLYTSNGSGAQKWFITSKGGGCYSIVNARSKKSLDVKNGSAISGANVQQYQQNDSLAQTWKIEYVGFGGFKVVSALDPSKVVDIAEGSLANGANIQIYSDNGSDAQRFKFSQTTYVPDPVDLPVPCYNQYLVGLPNGCEAAALTNVLNYYGFGLGPSYLADYWIPRSSTDWVYHYLGNPHNSTGNSIAAPGLTNSANAFLASRGSSLRAYELTGTPFNDLLHYLDEGSPVIIYGTVNMGRVGPIYLGYGTKYFAPTNSHTVVLKGYDLSTNTAYLSDTISGFTFWDIGWISSIYSQRGSQAVVIR